MTKEYKTWFTNFELSNFKAFSEPVAFPIRPITLLFGPNSAGKSSFMKALLLLKQSLTNEHPMAMHTSGDLINLGDYQDFVYNHDDEKIVSFKISINIQDLLLPKHLFRDQKPLIDKLSFICNSYKTIHFNVLYNETANIFDLPMKFYLGNEKTLFVKYNDEGGAYMVSSDFNHSFWKLYWDIFDKNDNNKLLHKLLKRLIDRELMDRELMSEDSLLEFSDAQKISLKEASEATKNFFINKKKQFENICDEQKGYKQALKLYELYFDCSEHEFHYNLSKSKRSEEAFAQMINEGFFKHGPLLVFSLIYFAIKEAFQNLCYIGPLRASAKRHYTFDRNFENSSFPMYGNSMPHQLFDGVNNDASLEVTGILNLNEQLKKLGSPYEIRISSFKNMGTGSLSNSLYSIDLYNSSNGIQTNFVDAGFGFSQILPVIFQCCVASSNRNLSPTIMIEQPELHLHPAMQSELGDLFINTTIPIAVEDGVKRPREGYNSLIIETHSEHLILRILRRIRETYEGKNKSTAPIYPDDVSVLYIDPGENGSRVIHLPITEDGDFEADWPNGFFDEREKELFD